MRKLSLHELQTSRSTSRDSGHDQIVAQLRSHEQDNVVNEPVPHPVDHGDMLLGREPGHDDSAANFLVDHVIPGYDRTGCCVALRYGRWTRYGPDRSQS